MDDYFSFRRLLTPGVIQGLFWLGVFICLLAGVGSVMDAARARYPEDVAGNVIAAIFLFLAGPVLVRVACEALIVRFRTLETLNEIKNKLEKS